MTPIETPANHDQAALWNAAGGQTWVELQALLDRVLTPFADLLMAEAFPGSGASVLDVGCGAGATTLAMARRLEPSGLALGVDISGPLIDAAKARARDEALEAAAFLQADAQTHNFDTEAFDAVISRFGVMFFDNPVAAFRNLRHATRRGGRLTFIAWRSPAENPFMTTAVRAAAPYLPPLPTPAPDAPGQFGFADRERVRGILEASDWSDIDLQPVDLTCEMPAADLMTYVTRLGPVGQIMTELDETTRRKVLEALKIAFAPFLEGDSARFATACWLVRAGR